MDWMNRSCRFYTTYSWGCQVKVQSWKPFAALPVSFMVCQHILGCTRLTDRILPKSTWLDYSVWNCFSPCVGFFFPPAELHSLSFCTAGCWDILLLPIAVLCLAHPSNLVTRKTRRLASFQLLVSADPVLQQVFEWWTWACCHSWQWRWFQCQ